MHPLNNRNPQLTISLLASNRPDTLPRCLDSLRAIREAVPSELILIDTSGNPEIHRLLSEYTEQVYEFVWCNDFAKARNEGLLRAKGEWFMFLDDDEWFVEPEPIIEFFCSGEYRNYGYANHKIRNFLNPKMSKYSDGWVSRLIRIDEDTRFVSKVHEYFYPLRGEKKDLEAMSYHTGYVYQTEAEKKAHFERNTSLLLKMIEEEPKNSRWYMQLIQEYVSVSMWQELQDHADAYVAKMEKGINAIQVKKARQGVQNITCPMAKMHLAGFYAAQALARYKLGEYEDCIALCQRYIDEGRCVELLEASLHYRMAECYKEQKRWIDVEMHIRVFLERVQDYVLHPEQYRQQIAQVVLCTDYDEIPVEYAYALFIQSALEQGNIEPLEQYYENIHWERPIIHAQGDLQDTILHAVVRMGYHPMFLRVLTDVYHNRGLRAIMNKLLTELEEDAVAYDTVMRVLAQVDVDDCAIWCARAYVAEKVDDLDYMNQAIQSYLRKADNVLDIPAGIHRMAKARFDLYEFIPEVEPERWVYSVENYMEKADTKQMESCYKGISEKLSVTHWKSRYLEVALKKQEYLNRDRSNAEAELLLLDWVRREFDFYQTYYLQEPTGEDKRLIELYREKQREEEQVIKSFETESYDDILPILHRFMLAELEYALQLYTDEAFEGDMEMLPPEIRGAVCLNNMFGRESGDWRGMIADLRQCVKCYPPLAPNIKYFIHKIGELLKS